MIVRSGLALSFPVLFATGFPDAAVTWKLYDGNGAQLGAGTATPPAGAVSTNIQISAAQNTLPNGSAIGSRDVAWSYTIGGAIVNGETRYDLEMRTPFGASEDGVRAKLGVDAKDISNSDISLMGGYLSFVKVVTQQAIDAQTDGGVNDLTFRNAIEAAAALALIPTMAVRVAAAEDSGTNSFKRQTIDWSAVADSLAMIVNAGYLAALPDYDPTSTADLFLLATPDTDPITGAAYG